MEGSRFAIALFFTATLLFVHGSAEMATKTNSSADVAGPVPADCLQCICNVESFGCTMPNPVCYMDAGSLSCGPFAIKQGYWSDATLKGGSLMGSWKACTATMQCSRDCVQGYMARYAVSSRLGHQPTCEDFARIHNGGPNGFKNPSTLGYWKKVQRCLQGGKKADPSAKKGGD